jgi:excinuclease ABC subunit A
MSLAVTNSYTGAALAKVRWASNRRRKRSIAPRTSKSPPSDARSHARRRRRASEHNLKSVDVEIPRDAMTVFCGPSGSGKSSLAMDTIYAEGQRRYVESLSVRPAIHRPSSKAEGRTDRGIIACGGTGTKEPRAHSPRSTVGTVTEVYDYSADLDGRLGHDALSQLPSPSERKRPIKSSTRCWRCRGYQGALLLAPIEVSAGEASKDTWASLRSTGYQRVRIDGVTKRWTSAPRWIRAKSNPSKSSSTASWSQESDRSRISDSVEQALSLGVGMLEVAIADAERDEHRWKTITHSQHLVCGDCGRSFPELTPHHFSFNSAVGWCPSCEGLGCKREPTRRRWFDPAAESLIEGAALLWPSVDQSVSRWMLNALVASHRCSASMCRSIN